MAYWTHESAIVDEGAQIGDGTKIWHFSHVCGKNVVIGPGGSFGQNTYIGNDVTIGRNARVQNNVSIYDRVELGDDVFCGPSVVFTNVINPRAHVSRKHEFKSTLVKRGASLGANATIVCGVVVGEYAFIGAGAVVTKDVPDFALVVGNPARARGWVCRCGVILPAAGAPVCRACGTAYALRDGTLSIVNTVD